MSAAEVAPIGAPPSRDRSRWVALVVLCVGMLTAPGHAFSKTSLKWSISSRSKQTRFELAPEV